MKHAGKRKKKKRAHSNQIEDLKRYLELSARLIVQRNAKMRCLGE